MDQDFDDISATFHTRLVHGTSAVMLRVCIYCTVSILAMLAMVTGFLTAIGAESLHVGQFHLDTQKPFVHLPAFFTEDPTGDPRAPGGMRHAIVGTGILIGLASVVGIPVGLLAGVYLAEYAGRGWLATPVRFVADVLSGVPSIVVGILGYELLVVPLGGYSGWAGAAALAFIMIPIAARTTEEMLLLVPNSYREAAAALGATKATTLRTVLLPAATGSLVTGVMLAIARVAGETAPLLFTALYSRYLRFDPSEQFPSLTYQIFEYAKDPSPKLQELAWAGILVLIALVFCLNLAIRLVTSKSQRFSA